MFKICGIIVYEFLYSVCKRKAKTFSNDDFVQIVKQVGMAFLLRQSKAFFGFMHLTVWWRQKISSFKMALIFTTKEASCQNLATSFDINSKQSFCDDTISWSGDRQSNIFIQDDGTFLSVYKIINILKAIDKTVSNRKFNVSVILWT